jgi:hypothetical protein
MCKIRGRNLLYILQSYRSETWQKQAIRSDGIFPSLFVLLALQVLGADGVVVPSKIERQIKMIGSEVSVFI